MEPAGACSEGSRGGVMARITDVEIGDVRCFEGVQSARTRRITLLVGENGAGKSTFLGCYRTLAKLANLHDLAEDNHFDEAPFQMGGFDSIARAGKTSFTLGGSFAEHCHDRVAFTFQAVDGRPVDLGMDLRFRGMSRSLHDLQVTASVARNVVLAPAESRVLVRSPSRRNLVSFRVDMAVPLRPLRLPALRRGSEDIPRNTSTD